VRRRIAKFLYTLGDAIGGLEAADEYTTLQIRVAAEEAVELADEEAELRDQEGLLNPSVPEQWHSSYYLRQSYRISSTHDDAQGHWRGGAPPDDGAECPICKKPLLLFWDINCCDPRFRHELPELFGELQRLPLYYCCRRPEPTIYQVLPGRRVHVFTPEMRGSEESPFRDFPDAFERRPLSLEPIPRDVENLLLISNEVTYDWLNEAERARLTQYLETDTDYGISLSQFGGIPRLQQGHQQIKCPNPKCLTHRMGHPIVRHHRHYEMKELAVIGQDARFEMDMNYAQIAFHICWKCHTIQAEYRCS
jgi:hypothetical protein